MVEDTVERLKNLALPDHGEFSCTLLREILVDTSLPTEELDHA
jgi:hypothetical protein